MIRVRVTLLMAAVFLAQASVAAMPFSDLRVLSHPLLILAVGVCLLAGTLRRER